MKRVMKMAVLAMAALMLTACGSKKAADTAENVSVKEEFVPKLDTKENVEIECAVFFGNFEALDQVINDFNEFYPNVKISYDQMFTDNSVPNFLQDNPSIDIFMTSNEKGYPQEGCTDLLAAGVDVSAVADGLLKAETVDGKLLTLPMALTLKGLVVNKTLLKNEGLEVPQTWPDFLKVLEALKEKGYTPIQGPDNAVSTLCYDMGMTMLNSDKDLLKAVESGDAEGASKLKAIYERMLELQDKGYFTQEVNAEYPENNYDGAILKFFEGDVPFWVCDTEKVSGMKKRESKSEAFTANPFEYEFMFAPLGDQGVYEYIEPWYGFAVNKDSDVQDYAVEFLRFMARQEELNTLASIKGVPAVTKESSDERYAGRANVEKIEASVISDGSISSFVGTYMESAAGELLTGELADADAALEQFVGQCAETVQGMQKETEGATEKNE